MGLSELTGSWISISIILGILRIKRLKSRIRLQIKVLFVAQKARECKCLGH